MSGPPAHGGPRGNLPTRPSAPPIPCLGLACRCRRRRGRRLPQAPLSPRKPHFRFFRMRRMLPPLVGCFSRRSAGRDQQPPSDASTPACTARRQPQQATLSPARAAPTRESGGCPPPGFFSLYGGSVSLTLESGSAGPAQPPGTSQTSTLGPDSRPNWSVPIWLLSPYLLPSPIVAC